METSTPEQLWGSYWQSFFIGQYASCAYQSPQTWPWFWSNKFKSDNMSKNLPNNPDPDPDLKIVYFVQG